MKNIVCNFFVIFLVLSIFSCTTTKYVEKPVDRIVEVPVEVVKTEYIHDTKIDSVFIRDSVDRWHEGDTFYIYKERTKFKYLNKIDTIIKTDTISKTIEVINEKRVEVNHIKWWQKTLMWLGGLMILLSSVFITYKIKFK